MRILHICKGNKNNTLTITCNITFQILPGDGKLIKEEIIKKKILFTESEEDTLVKYIYESVTKPKFTNELALKKQEV